MIHTITSVFQRTCFKDKTLDKDHFCLLRAKLTFIGFLIGKAPITLEKQESIRKSSTKNSYCTDTKPITQTSLLQNQSFKNYHYISNHYNFPISKFASKEAIEIQLRLHGQEIFVPQKISALTQCSSVNFNFETQRFQFLLTNSPNIIILFQVQK